MTEANNVVELTDEKIESLDIELRKVSTVPRCLVVSMKGYIDTYNAPHFQRRVAEVFNAGYIRLIFDFSGISYISSTGIGAFTSVLKNVKPRGGDMVLLGMIDRVFEVFQLLGFSSFFNITNTVEEAIDYLSIQSRSTHEGPFPKVFGCPSCGKRLKAPRHGRFRCSECKTILVINKSGQVLLG